MEIAATSLADYRAYTGVVPEGAVAAVQEEEKAVVEIPAKDTESQEQGSDNGQKEQAVPLSTGADVRAYTATTPEAQADSSKETTEGSSDASTTGSEATDQEGSTDAALTGELTPEEEQQVTELKARDLEVRQHEQSHLAAAGSFASGGAQFEYQTGPDGKQYAIGGHVNIDTSREGSPDATIAKARIVQRAALAPADPSPQDVRIAAQASQMILEAQRELAQENSDEEGGSSVTTPSGLNSGFGRLEDMGSALNSESF